MDVFSLLKFWKITGGGNLTPAGDFDSTVDDEESFIDLVLTNSGEESEFDYVTSPKVTGIKLGVGESKSSFRFASPGDVCLSNKRKSQILPLDSPNRKAAAPQSPLRLWMLGFQNNQKMKSEKERSSENEINEEVKIGELLRRDNSLRCKLRTEKLLENEQYSSSKRFSKDVVNKYLNLIKPSHKVSKRTSEKSRLSDQSITPSSSPASSIFSPRKEDRKSGGRSTVFRDVRKHLGKSRSASAMLQTSVAKSDDSAIEQQDAIQGAILHCKRSFNSPSQGSMLSRSGSAPSKNENQVRVSIEEEKRSSI